MEELKPILTSHLFPVLDSKLIQLLETLGTEEWSRKSLPQWTVKDIAAHLLDSNVRRLSIGRDSYWGVPFTGSTREELNSFLNGLNHNWVEACRRLSPRLLVDLLRKTGQELSAYFLGLDPTQRAIFSVSWAGEESSVNWFDIAREYTEKWHHQQQIRDAVNRPGIITPELYAPVIATFMRVLPFTYREISMSEGTVIQFHISGESGGDWALVREADRWSLKGGTARKSACEIVIPGDIAWKLFTKGLSRAEKLQAINISGDKALGDPALTATAIVG